MPAQASFVGDTDTFKREQLWKALENPPFRRAFSADQFFCHRMLLRARPKKEGVISITCDPTGAASISNHHGKPKFS